MYFELYLKAFRRHVLAVAGKALPDVMGCVRIFIAGDPFPWKPG
jgi:hypothetical protein